MNKLSALQYVSSNVNVSDDSFQSSVLRHMIMEDKDVYTQEELDDLIEEMSDF